MGRVQRLQRRLTERDAVTDQRAQSGQLRVMRAAVDRCRSFEVTCDVGVAQRIRTLMTREYLRLMETPKKNNPSSMRKSTEVMNS